MKVKGVRLYAKDDIRLEEFELPEIKDDEILVKVMSDSICMSTWKMVKQGANHKQTISEFQQMSQNIQLSLAMNLPEIS